MSFQFGWPEWMLEGACRDIPREELDRIFFALETDVSSAEKAKEICAACPVKQTCLEYALGRQDIGIWGGTTNEERKEIRRNGKSND